MQRAVLSDPRCRKPVGEGAKPVLAGLLEGLTAEVAKDRPRNKIAFKTVGRRSEWRKVVGIVLGEWTRKSAGKKIS